MTTKRNVGTGSWVRIRNKTLTKDIIFFILFTRLIYGEFKTVVAYGIIKNVDSISEI